MELLFDEATHTYTVDGRVIKSVTQIIDEFCPFPVSGPAVERAASFGKAAHATIELYERGNLGEYDNALEPWLNGWKKFRADKSSLVELEEPVIEMMLYSERYGYAGTIDRAMYDTAKKEICLIDIKSGAYSPTWDLQTAGYENLLKQKVVSQMAKVRRMCVLISENDYKIHIPKHPFAYDFNIFNSMLNVTKWKKENHK